GDAGAAGSAGSARCGAPPLAWKPRTSAVVTRPCGPVGGTRPISTPSCRASRRVAGVASTRWRAAVASTTWIAPPVAGGDGAAAAIDGPGGNAAAADGPGGD